MLHQEFKNALKEDTVDYSLYTANIKRKRPTATPRKVRKSGPMAMPAAGGNSEEEGDDDEDWGGAMRKINFSGGRRSSLRFSRQN